MNMRHPVTLENKEAIKAKWGMPKGHGNQLEGNSTGQRWGTLNTEQKKKGNNTFQYGWLMNHLIIPMYYLKLFCM